METRSTSCVDSKWKVISTIGFRQKLRGANGKTLVEVLVVCFIIGLLAALMLPTVVNVRESMRRTSCANNLYQIGIATQNFVQSNRRFPSSHYLTEIHAYLGIDASIDDFGASSPSVVRCPSDALAWSGHSPCNYGTNTGTKFEEMNGMTWRLKTVKTGDVTDGLSNTAYASERLIMLRDNLEANSEIDPTRKDRMIARRWYFHSPRLYSKGEEEIFRADHKSNQTMFSELEQVHLPNRPSFSGSYVYHHLTPPNSIAISQVYSIGPIGDVSPPSSAHRDGVHLLFADGHVQFFSQDVDMTVWSSIGTRNGSEPGLGGD